MKDKEIKEIEKRIQRDRTYQQECFLDFVEWRREHHL